MSRPPDRPEVPEATRLRALAHPLRWALIDTLAAEGEATAARCAQLLSESQASCSFHLRTLARSGFVEEAPTSSKRERPWRLSTRRQHLGTAVDDAGGMVAAEVSRVFVEREASKLFRWIATRRDEPVEWRDSAFFSGLTSWLMAEELSALDQQLRELLRPYETRLTDGAQRPRSARLVRVFTAGFPLPK